MAGISNWNVKPEREADAHPHETYCAENDCYYYDPAKVKKRVLSDIDIECDITPVRTEEYAEIIRNIIRNDYPDFEVASEDIPIAVRMSVYPAHFYAGGLQPYVIGESVIEWEKWLYGALNGLVWASEKQICVTGTEIRHRDHCGIRINIYLICEQSKKKNNER